MSFHENAVFPLDMGYETAGAPTHNTIVVALDSGAEQRLPKWNGARRVYEINYDTRSHDKLAELQEFIIKRRGSTFGFRLRDFYDCTSASPGFAPELGGQLPTSLDVLIGEGDGSKTDFQLVKYYQDNDTIRTRNIVKPVAGTVSVALDGVTQSNGWSVNTATGVVTFSVAPALGVEITAGFEFDTPVRFTEDAEKNIRMAIQNYGSGDASGVEMIEILEVAGTDEQRYLGGSKNLGEITEDITLSPINGVVQVLDVQAPGKKAKLPSISNLAGGGPYFYLINDGVHDIGIYKSDGTSLVGTLQAGEMKVVVLEVNTSTWYMG